jgi:hypothetical protein
VALVAGRGEPGVAGFQPLGLHLDSEVCQGNLISAFSASLRALRGFAKGVPSWSLDTNRRLEVNSIEWNYLALKVVKQLAAAAQPTTFQYHMPTCMIKQGENICNCGVTVALELIKDLPK